MADINQVIRNRLQDILQGRLDHPYPFIYLFQFKSPLYTPSQIKP